MKFIPKYKYLLIANLVLGLFLCFLYCTDFSLSGTISDIVFPIIVAVVAIISEYIAKEEDKRQRILKKLALLPAKIGGGLHVLLIVIMFIPPFTLGGLFAAAEISDEVQIQTAISPDGKKAALVYFRPVGAYSGGNGRVYIRIRNRIIPFLERDIFYARKSFADEEINDYLEWRDQNTLYVHEFDIEIPVGLINPEIPQVLALPVGMVALIIHLLSNP